jgi:hypothetical protein
MRRTAERSRTKRRADENKNVENKNIKEVAKNKKGGARRKTNEFKAEHKQQT